MSGEVVFSKVHEASAFREISVEDEKKELEAKIAIFVSAALLAIGSVIAAYYTFQSNSSELVVFPAALGGCAAIALIVWGALQNRSKRTCPSAEYPYKPSKISDAQFEKELLHLTTENLEKIHVRYAHIGMAFLPENAVISNPQAKELSRLIEAFGPAKMERDVYLKDQATAQEAQNNPGKFPKYGEITKRIAALESDWKTLQAAILKDYTQ
jgi:hypothetical protein